MTATGEGLADRGWKAKYSAEDGDIVRAFYVPALTRAVRYDRTTGYFTATALAIAARGVEGLIGNGGRMRLIVGCTLDAAEAEAIDRGLAAREAVERRLAATPLTADDAPTAGALELLAWMVAHGHLEVKVAVPCDERRRPASGGPLFHEKVGIVEDGRGDRLSFAGGINETAQGWTRNWDSFHVFASWKGGAEHIDEDEADFARLWADRAKAALVFDVPGAVRAGLLPFLPKDGALPERLAGVARPPAPVSPPAAPEAPAAVDPRRALWAFIRRAPTLPGGGHRVGEATSAVTPWPHQIHAFHRMYDPWTDERAPRAPRLLIADEVGLGKTIQAGLLLRQGWLAGRVRRALVLAPPAVLRQWQAELREKFNLNWPIYDGRKLVWCASPAFNGRIEREVARTAWHHEPFVLASSYLMRRRERQAELTAQAEPWDIIVVDEAHHARRRLAGMGDGGDRPNLLLRLLRDLKGRSEGLVLLTATPMQVDPVEVWDLLNLLGLPPEWHPEAFLGFFRDAAGASPSDEAMTRMARLFRACEAAFGEVSLDDARRFVPAEEGFYAARVLRALRAEGTIEIARLEADQRRGALRLMMNTSPVRRLISRHTRELLRRYRDAGKLDIKVADRRVEDEFIAMSEDERRVYDAVEAYISTTYNRASAERRTAVGFVMTIYRRRLASSFGALGKTLANRLDALTSGGTLWMPTEEDVAEGDTEAGEDELAPDAAEDLARRALKEEERDEILRLREWIGRLPRDTKADRLLDVLDGLRRDGHRQAIVFTQFTDTLDFLRGVVTAAGITAMCFSGRGGEIRSGDGWMKVSRDEIKRKFRAGEADLLLCTDAAAEGLNFQFCGALVNYDLPWNPMRVEQRIGRIDRLGQAFQEVRIVNLHYEDTVETDVYLALRKRIGLFERFVGRLQPILARLPRVIAEATLAQGDEAELRSRVVDQLDRQVDRTEAETFDLDELAGQDLELPPRPEPPYDLGDLDAILRRPDLLPPGRETKAADGKSLTFLAPGMEHRVRVTADAGYYEAHADSCELWSPGSPLFPEDPSDTTPVDGAEAGAEVIRELREAGRATKPGADGAVGR